MSAHLRSSGALVLTLVLACSPEVGPPDDTEPFFTTDEWDTLQTLTGLGDPPADPSNAYADDAAAAALGQKLYFDPEFSGRSTLKDTLGRDVPADVGRAPAGQELGIACASCHDPSRGGSDHESATGVSLGAGAYDVNGQSTVNASYYDLLYWNGRSDSLWAQIVAVSESTVSMGSNRLRIAWRLADGYRAEYEALFGALPMSGTVAELKTSLVEGGQCATLEAGCPAGCVADANGCWPRFPLEGRPGPTAGCQRGEATEPLGDAFDCMADADRAAVTRVLVNFAKAIAAYERKLVSRDAPFDTFMAAGEDSGAIELAAKRGAKLFVGEGACVACHSGPLLSDDLFHNVGVTQQGDFVPTETDCPAGAKCDCVAGTNCLPWGFYDGLKKLQANKFRRDSEWSDAPTDTSRAAYYTAALGEEMKGQWRTPGLRDVALTAPYMHTGAYATLAEALALYNEAPGVGLVGTVDPLFHALGLSEAELSDLEQFLLTLTGAPLPEALTTAPELPAPTQF